MGALSELVLSLIDVIKAEAYAARGSAARFCFALALGAVAFVFVAVALGMLVVALMLALAKVMAWPWALLIAGLISLAIAAVLLVMARGKLKS